MDFAAFQIRKKVKSLRFFAFSPKASKSSFEQAGLLTYPLFSAFPSRQPTDSGNSAKKFTGLTAAGTVQESPGLTDSPVSLLHSKTLETCSAQMYTKVCNGGINMPKVVIFAKQ